MEWMILHYRLTGFQRDPVLGFNGIFRDWAIKREGRWSERSLLVSSPTVNRRKEGPIRLNHCIFKDDQTLLNIIQTLARQSDGTPLSRTDDSHVRKDLVFFWHYIVGVVVAHKRFVIWVLFSSPPHGWFLRATQYFLSQGREGGREREEPLHQHHNKWLSIWSSLAVYFQLWVRISFATFYCDTPPYHLAQSASQPSMEFIYEPEPVII